MSRGRGGPKIAAPLSPWTTDCCVGAFYCTCSRSKQARARRWGEGVATRRPKTWAARLAFRPHRDQVGNETAPRRPGPRRWRGIRGPERRRERDGSDGERRWRQEGGVTTSARRRPLCACGADAGYGGTLSTQPGEAKILLGVFTDFDSVTSRLWRVFLRAHSPFGSHYYGA